MSHIILYSETDLAMKNEKSVQVIMNTEDGQRIHLLVIEQTTLSPADI